MSQWVVLCVVVGLLVLPFSVAAAAGKKTTITERPSVGERKFTSRLVEKTIEEFDRLLVDAELARLFRLCFPNTLDSAVVHRPELDDTWVSTGDIGAMWLRDSAGQVRPYVALLPRLGGDAESRQLHALLRGVVRRQLRSVAKDAYANAFNLDDDGRGHQQDQRRPPMSAGVFEGKWELDSLAYVLDLTWRLYTTTKDRALLDSDYRAALRAIYDVLVYQQRGSDEQSSDDPLYYSFARGRASGGGGHVRRTGMVKCQFRPSDDETRYGFHVPSNAFAVVALRRTAWLLRAVLADGVEAGRFEQLAAQIDAGIRRWGVVPRPDSPDGQLMFAYEVDGRGNALLMDDANVPSLLSLPYIEYCDADDPVYLNTRAFVLSAANPYYFVGSVGSGVGSPRTGPDAVWPMSIVMQAFTSTSDDEVARCLQQIKRASMGGLLHESFDSNDAARFTRARFAWTNSLFAQLVLRLANTRPHLLFGPDARPSADLISLKLRIRSERPSPVPQPFSGQLDVMPLPPPPPPSSVKPAVADKHIASNNDNDVGQWSQPRSTRVSIAAKLSNIGGSDCRGASVLAEPFLRTFAMLIDSPVGGGAGRRALTEQLKQLRGQVRNGGAHLTLGQVVPLIEEMNQRGAILNDASLPPVEDGYVPLLVLVHRRHNYVRAMLDALRDVVNINKTLVVFSCDGFFPDVLHELLSVTFVRVKIVYYPVPISMLAPGDYPGFDGTSHLVRDVKVISLKGHWWWAHHYVWGDRTWQPPRCRGSSADFAALAYIEEDHALTPDFYETMQGLLALQPVACPDCTFINMGVHTHAHSPSDLRTVFQIRSKPIDNIGIVTRRSVWQRVTSAARTFCLFDDYNWDWSIKALIKEAALGHTALIPALTRIEHFGHHCGLHTDMRDGAACEAVETLGWIDPIRDQLERLRRSDWQAVTTKIPKQKDKQPQGGFGGWSDPRDQALCMAYVPQKL